MQCFVLFVCFSFQATLFSQKDFWEVIGCPFKPQNGNWESDSGTLTEQFLLILGLAASSCVGVNEVSVARKQSKKSHAHLLLASKALRKKKGRTSQLFWLQFFTFGEYQSQVHCSLMLPLFEKGYLTFLSLFLPSVEYIELHLPNSVTIVVGKCLVFMNCL